MKDVRVGNMEDVLGFRILVRQMKVPYLKDLRVGKPALAILTASSTPPARSCSST